MVRTLHLHDQASPEPARILAIAAAIAIHAMAFLLLLLPLASGPIERAVAPTPQFQWIVPEVVPVTPPLPPQPVRQPRVKPPQPTPRPVVVPRVESPPIAVDRGTLQADPTDPLAVDTSPTQITVDTGGPLSGAQLRYAHAPAPAYPRVAARDGAEGTVLLKVLVDVDGTPLEVTLQKSSGNRALDAEARSHVLRRWRFEPAMRGGRPVQAYGLVPIEFSMQ